MVFKATLNKSHAASASLLWAVCGVANTRNTARYFSVALIIDQDSTRTHWR
jgi:hypothetical protein